MLMKDQNFHDAKKMIVNSSQFLFAVFYKDTTDNTLSSTLDNVADSMRLEKSMPLTG